MPQGGIGYWADGYWNVGHWQVGYWHGIRMEPPSNRKFTVPPNDRTIIVSRHDRAIIVVRRDRTYIVPIHKDSIMLKIPVYSKDPDETLDYIIDWATHLGSDTIDTSTWARATDSTGITIDSNTNTTTTATVWLSGGTLGEYYTLTNTIVTAGGRTLEQSIKIHMEAH